MKERLLIGLIAIAILATSTIAFAGGFDDAGYNRQARIFVGTGWSWCMDKVGDEAWCTSYLGDYANDKLVMKWNEEWDRGNDEGWSNPPYDAWEDNQWNGMCDGCSDSVWHYKYKWIGPCGAYGDPTPNGGYCIWGQFEVIMSHGKDPYYGLGHVWDSHAIPTGYGTPIE